LSSQCVKCAAGYFPSNIDLAKCIPEIPRCKSYTPTDTCLTCYEGFFLVNGKCNFCDTNNNFVPKNNACVCKSGFRVSDLDSKKCLPKVPNCNFYEQDICTTCSEKYSLTTDYPPKCDFGVENCDKYSNINVLNIFSVCTKCKPNYYLLLNKCISIPKISNCVNYYPRAINILKRRNVF
jgi:hypothetical protein